MGSAQAGGGKPGVALHLVSIAGIIGVLWQSDHAKKEVLRATCESQRGAGNSRAESKRAESEVWNANYCEARALGVAGGARRFGSTAISVQSITSESAPDGSALLTSAWDTSSMVWDLVSGRPLVKEQRLFVHRD